MKKKKWFIGIAAAAACAVIALTSGVASSPKTETPVYAAGTSVDISSKVFSSWNTKPDGSGTSYQPGDDVGKLTKDMDLYAQWSAPKPLTLGKSQLDKVDKKGCTVVANQYGGTYGLRCVGACKRSWDGDEPAEHYAGDYIGAMFKIDVTDYNKLSYYAKKVKDNGCVFVELFDSSGKAYSIDLSDLTGTVTILFQGGYVDYTGAFDSETIFSDITFS